MTDLQPPSIYDVYEPALPLLSVFVFIIGTFFGSFFNVCIWRIPLGESIILPTSRCPKCSYEIQWYENIPILSWLLLRGRCSQCHTRISSRYLIIEAVTGILFLLIWFRLWDEHWPIPVLFAFWFIAGSLVVITFIDLKHFIIPDEVTLTGLAAAIVYGLLFPSTHVYGHTAGNLAHRMEGHPITYVFSEIIAASYPSIYESPRMLAALDIFLGIVLGAGILWLIGEIGKLIWGRKKHTRQDPVTMRLSTTGFEIVEEPGPVSWDDVLVRDTDVLRIHAETIRWQSVRGEEASTELCRNGDTGTTLVTVDRDGLRDGDRRIALSDLAGAEILTRKWIEPREAMGFGDVKLVGMLGAFLGPEAAMLILCTASVFGSAYGVFLGVSSIVRRRAKWQSHIPFGPFLAAAGLLYLMTGTALFDRLFGNGTPLQ